MYFVFLCFYKNEINITNKKKKKMLVLSKRLYIYKVFVSTVGTVFLFVYKIFRIPILLTISSSRSKSLNVDG